MSGGETTDRFQCISIGSVLYGDKGRATISRKGGTLIGLLARFSGSRCVAVESTAPSYYVPSGELVTLDTVNAIIGNRTQYTDEEIEQLIAEGFSVNVFKIDMTQDLTKLRQLLTDNPDDGFVDLTTARWFIHHSQDNKYYDINSVEIKTVEGDRQVEVHAGYDRYKYLATSIATSSATWTELPGSPSNLDIFEDVTALPTSGISSGIIYRRMETVYKHDGVEVPNVTMYKVSLNDTIEATPEGMRYKPSGPVVAWNSANIAAVIQQAITDGHVETTTWDNAEFFAYGDGRYNYESHFSRLLPGSLWQNVDGTAAGWKEIGGEPAIDEVTIVEEHGVLHAVAVIDVTTLPSAGMKANTLYRKVETVNVPGLHIYTTYYHGGADPVPEPVECYKPARAGVEFRTNEIYIDSVEHSYEELRVYKADWVAAGYIVACEFLDIDTTTNDGAVGYPNEGSYQFLNRERYTYNTDPVPVVMNKIFQRTPGGEWESISTVQISQAAYNELDYDQKMDGTTYIVEG